MEMSFKEKKVKLMKKSIAIVFLTLLGIGVISAPAEAYPGQRCIYDAECVEPLSWDEYVCLRSNPYATYGRCYLKVYR